MPNVRNGWQFRVAYAHTMTCGTQRVQTVAKLHFFTIANLLQLH